MNERQLAFSGNGRTHTCTDCGAPAGNHVTYSDYSIGDIVCRRHQDWRLTCLPRKAFGDLVPDGVRVVPFDV